MRVIAGRARGTNLIAPEGTGTRPTTDRTKETLFNVLMPDIPDCIFLDLFSGSGAIAIEALSRGAKEAHLVEKDKKAVACIRQNLKKTHMDSGEASVYAQDYAIVLEQLRLEKKQFDIVFMDPPYQKELEKDVLHQLIEKGLLKKDALVVVEADLNTDFSYLAELPYRLWKEKRYKTNMHLFFIYDGLE